MERRDQITELLAAQIKQKVDDEEQHIAKAVAEMEAKNKKETQEKEEKIKSDIKAITEHRLAMVITQLLLIIWIFVFLFMI